MEHKALHLSDLRKLRAAKGEHAKQGNNYESSSYAPRITITGKQPRKNEHGGSSPTPQPHQTQRATAPIAKSNSTNRKSDRANPKSDSANRKKQPRQMQRATVPIPKATAPIAKAIAPNERICEGDALEFQGEGYSGCRLEIV